MRLRGACRLGVAGGVLLSVLAAGSGRAAQKAEDLGPSIRTISCSTATFLDLEAVLPGALRQGLERVPSQGARSAARFVAGHPGHLLRIAVSSLDREYYWPADAIDQDVLMGFSSRLRGFKLNHRCLHAGGLDEAVLLREHEAFSGFIESLLPIFVHEVSHARVAEAFPFPIPHSIEDEITGAYRGMLFLTDALAHDPRFMGLGEAAAVEEAMRGYLQGVKDLGAEVAALRQSREQGADIERRLDAAEKRRIELQAQGERLRPEYERRFTDIEATVLMDLASFVPSNRTFEADVRRHYERLGSVFGDPKQMLAGAQEELRQCQDLLTFARAMAARPGLSPVQKAKAEHDEAAMVDRTEEAREQMRFWADPVRFTRARAYFDRLLSGLRAEADLRRRRQRQVLRRYRRAPGLSALAPFP